jgi:dTDP-4-amino-4,6-dideoxygalactose transaminase|tara:strand:- start:7914 stop:9110 length:1197 start_codon:yes stop_codon:yes gene_type:complete
MKPSEKIPLFKVFMADTAAPEVTKVLNSGFIGQGPKVDQFEQQLQDYFNHKHIQTLNAGTSALHMALHLLKKPKPHWNEDVFQGVAWVSHNWPGLEDGDEVLCTAMTCTASNWPVLANNLKIKWVDIDPKTLNMDLDDLERKITKKTKVIMGVHWGGYPLDLDRLRKIRTSFRGEFGWAPAVIEDGAHSFGSKYKGKFIGTSDNLTMFSLQAIKHITSIDGGLLFSPHQELHDRGKLIRWYGIDRDSDRKDFRCEADIPEWGYKFHMNDVCATVGMENFKHLDSIISKHKENAAYYDLRLQNVPGVTLLERKEGFESAFWIYTMLVDDRDGFYKYMDECNIAVSQVHERNDKHTCVEEFKTELPNLDKTIGKVVNIPVGWWITPEQREYIVECIRKGW